MERARLHTLIEIIYYTDPYCTWCWGSEPVLRHLVETFGAQIKFTYIMGGLVEDIADFHDPTNDISTFDQVAPHWLEASSRHGMPVDITVFDRYKDDLRSTYPANIAYKAAELQSQQLAERYLRRLREGAAALGLPIHRRATQVELAVEIGLDGAQFAEDIESGRAEAAFRSDLQEARSHGITGFPTFVIRNQKGEQVTMNGYQSFAEFARVIDTVSGEPLERRGASQLEDFVKKYQRVAPQEVAEVFGITTEEAVEGLNQLKAAKRARTLPAGTGEFWEPTG